MTLPISRKIAIEQPRAKRAEHTKNTIANLHRRNVRKALAAIENEAIAEGARHVEAQQAPAGDHAALAGHALDLLLVGAAVVHDQGVRLAVATAHKDTTRNE